MGGQQNENFRGRTIRRSKSTRSSTTVQYVRDSTLEFRSGEMLAPLLRKAQKKHFCTKISVGHTMPHARSRIKTCARLKIIVSCCEDTAG